MFVGVGVVVKNVMVLLKKKKYFKWCGDFMYEVYVSRDVVN